MGSTITGGDDRLRKLQSRAAWGAVGTDLLRLAPVLLFDRLEMSVNLVGNERKG